jgi:integrase
MRGWRHGDALRQPRLRTAAFHLIPDIRATPKRAGSQIRPHHVHSTANYGRGEGRRDTPHFDPAEQRQPAWNSGKTIGTKRPLTQKQIWAVRSFLDRERRLRDRALFDLAIDSKLRGCDLVKIKIADLISGAEIKTRAIVTQQKTGRPVQFELTADVRASLFAWFERRGGGSTTTLSQAAPTTLAISARGNMLGSWMSGSMQLGFDVESTERTLYVAPRHR